MNEKQTAIRAIERAKAGKTLPLRAIFAALGGQGPTRLARTPELDAHEAGAQATNPDDATGWLSLADHYDETGEPGSAFLREHAKHLQEQHLLLGSHKGPARSERDRTLENRRIMGLYVQPLIAGPGDKYTVYERQTDRGPPNTDHYFPRVVVRMRLSNGFPIHVEATPENVERLANDMRDQPDRADGLRRSVARAYPTPTRLARAPDAITYVGGSTPTGQRAIGFWSGGREPSSVVSIPAQHVDRAAVELAKRNGQKSALWFTPGAGNDILHVLSVADKPGIVARALTRHGINEFTLIPSAGRTVVHIVDAGGQRASAVRAYAAESGAQYSAQPGTSRFVTLGPTKMARKPVAHKWETIPHTSPELRNWWTQVYNEGDVDPVAAGVLGDWLEERNDWRHHIARKLGPGIGARGYLEGLVGHEGKPDDGAFSHVYRLPDGLIRLHTAIPRPDSYYRYIGSTHTPEEYEAMRKDAATAGVHFPKVK